MIKNNKYILGTLAALLLGMGTANAVPILSLSPAAQSAVPTDMVSVDLVASGLPADGIGAFDIDIAYDSAALSFQSYSLGTALGDLLFFDAIDISFGDLGGIVNLAELSFLFDLSFQGPGPIVLATLNFMVNVLPPGGSTFLDIIPIAIASGNGTDITGGPIMAAAAINNPRVTVPEPATLTLFLTGLLLLRRRVTG